jgi:hypothetical protein
MEDVIMESERFDSLSRVLGTGASRRGALGLLAGLAGLGLGEAGARKRTRRGTVRTQKAGGEQLTPERARKAAKVALCHYDEAAGTYATIVVGAPAAEAHFGHHPNDTPYVNCCVDDDCPAGEACDAGTCRASTCAAATCGDECSFCYNLAGGGTICGGSASAFCAQTCTTQDDCPGTLPCVVSFLTSSGTTHPWTCGTAPGICTTITSCS